MQISQSYQKVYPPHLLSKKEKYLHKVGEVIYVLPGGMYGKVKILGELILVKRSKHSPRFHQGDLVQITDLELSDLVVTKVSKG